MAVVSRPNTLPDNYPATPASYPIGMFRLQVEAAKRYLFESELKEILEAADLPPNLLDTGNNEARLNVAQMACFFQGMRAVIGDTKAVEYGQDAFKRLMPVLSRTTTSNLLRPVSSVDKQFLRIRDAISGYNQRVGANFLVKWHGGAECDLFEDTGQHCYGFTSDELICPTMIGFLQQAIGGLSGIKVLLDESECMATGALACRWHCRLA